MNRVFFDKRSKKWIGGVRPIHLVVLALTCVVLLSFLLPSKPQLGEPQDIPSTFWGDLSEKRAALPKPQRQDERVCFIWFGSLNSLHHRLLRKFQILHPGVETIMVTNQPQTGLSPGMQQLSINKGNYTQLYSFVEEGPQRYQQIIPLLDQLFEIKHWQLLSDIVRLMLLKKCVYTDIDTFWQQPVDLSQPTLVYGDTIGVKQQWSQHWYTSPTGHNCFVYYNGFLSVHNERVVDLLVDGVPAAFNVDDFLCIGPKYISRIISQNKLEHLFRIVPVEQFFTTDFYSIVDIFQRNPKDYLQLCDRYIRLQSNIHIWTSTPKDAQQRETVIYCLFEYEKRMYPELGW